MKTVRLASTRSMMVVRSGPGGVLEDDPVADARQTGLLELEAQSPGELCGTRACPGPDLVGAAVLGRDPGRDRLALVPGLELSFEEGAEAQRGKFVHDHVLGRRRRGGSGRSLLTEPRPDAASATRSSSGTPP